MIMSFFSERWVVGSDARDILFLDQFGDGLADTVWPSMVEVVGELAFVGPEGEVVGCTFFRNFCSLVEVLSKDSWLYLLLQFLFVGGSSFLR